MDTVHPPPFLGILGFPGYFDHPRIILGWTKLISSLSEYPGIPGILRPVQNHLRMDKAHLPMSEYPGIPEILRPSLDHPGMDRAYPFPPYMGILGFHGYIDHPRIILGWMDTAHFPCLSILRFSGHSGHHNIILGWTQSTHSPCQSILGFPRHSATSRSSRDGRCSPPYIGINTWTIS